MDSGGKELIMYILTDSFSLNMLPNALCVDIRIDEVNPHDIPCYAIKSFIRDIETAVKLELDLGFPVHANYEELHIGKEDQLIVVQKTEETFKFKRIAVMDCKDAEERRRENPVTFDIK